MKIGWFGNREKYFNNFQYIKNALSNSQYFFWKELIERGSTVTYVGKVNTATHKSGKFGEMESHTQMNMGAWEEYQKSGKDPGFDSRFAISLQDKIKSYHEWLKEVNGWENVYNEMMKDEYFPEEDFDVLWIDNFLNMHNLGFSLRLKTLMDKYPNALVFVYDEAGEWLEAMFDERAGFTKDDIERVVVLGTYSRKARYYSHNVRGVEPFYYGLDPNMFLDVCETPQTDIQYFGRILPTRNAHYEMVFDCSSMASMRCNTDFNLSKVSSWFSIPKGTEDELFQKIEDARQEKENRLGKKVAPNNQIRFIQNYPQIDWNLNYCLPCDIYREYNTSRMTFVPVPNDRAMYGLISLRPWEAVIAGTITVYTQKFFNWSSFTDESFIVSDSNPVEDIVKRIQGMSFADRKKVIEENRDRFDWFEFDNLADYFCNLCSKYADPEYREETPFIRRVTRRLTDEEKELMGKL